RCLPNKLTCQRLYCFCARLRADGLQSSELGNEAQPNQVLNTIMVVQKPGFAPKLRPILEQRTGRVVIFNVAAAVWLDVEQIIEHGVNYAAVRDEVHLLAHVPSN